MKKCDFCEETKRHKIDSFILSLEGLTIEHSYDLLDMEICWECLDLVKNNIRECLKKGKYNLKNRVREEKEKINNTPVVPLDSNQCT
ncbi:hypothetical protein KAR91_77370 [Candidatus Pacearchaeota archaeon]|nr:hypothetical protein [Candidatus Pacearchaeota archaeon]